MIPLRPPMSFRLAKKELTRRSRADVEDRWTGLSPRERDVLRATATIVRQEFYWPNGLYIPEDHCAVLLLEHSSGCSIENAIIDIEQELCLVVPAPDEEGNVLDRILRITFGELIEGIARIPERPR